MLAVFYKNTVCLTFNFNKLNNENDNLKMQSQLEYITLNVK